MSDLSIIIVLIIIGIITGFLIALWTDCVLYRESNLLSIGDKVLVEINGILCLSEVKYIISGLIVVYLIDDKRYIKATTNQVFKIT